ncbi:MAG TPA: glycine betaine/L-proline ABC transporter ATP-binding protein [Bacteroidales bacterium]|nr:glycine betaine/L-proline ABC transporter ATP-binding protein [Bacteroidales bacterium]
MAQIEVKDLTLIFGKQKQQALKLLEQGKGKDEILAKTKCTLAVNQVNLEIKQGEIFVIMGLSGSGKSSLLRCFNRLNQPTRGGIYYSGDNIMDANKDELLKIRRNDVSMVFQHFGLLPHRTVADNVAFGLEIQGVDKAERRETALKTIKTVGLDGYEDMMTGELSGGMQQRVGLARALATDPETLLMDEAFSALDPLIRSNMQDELLDLQEKVHKTILFITHDLDEALKLGDRIAIMKDGKIVQVDTPEGILSNPADDYVKSFVEDVEHGKIITAGTIMFKNPERLRLKKSGPKTALRQMRKFGVTSLPVVTDDNVFVGFVKDADMAKLQDEDYDVIPDEHIYKGVNTVKPDTVVSDMLLLFLDNQLNLAVVDDDNKLLGVVVHSSVLAEMLGLERDDVKKVKESGLEILEDLNNG